MWWPIIEHLTAYLNNDYLLQNLPGLTIKAGVEGGIPDYPAIRVCRGGERKRSILTRGKGEVTVLIDCWEGSDDQDPSVAYKLISALEERVLTVVEEWMNMAPGELKLRMQLEDDIDTDADGEMFRPVVGSTIKLKIKWNK